MKTRGGPAARRRVARHSRLSAAVMVAALASTAATSSAQLPDARLSAVYPAGAQPGTAVEVALVGTDLDEAASLYFSHPGITASPATGEPSPFDVAPPRIPGRFVVSVASDVPAGVYDLRAIGKFGVSTPRAFVIGTAHEIVEIEPNDGPDAAQVSEQASVVHGRLDRTADVDWYILKAQSGERVLIDCWARRIDSPLDAVLLAFDRDGRELATSTRDRQGDSLLDLVAPQGGEFVVCVHDVGFRGGPEYTYRLAHGDGPYIDTVFPPCGQPGTQGEFVVYGRRLPGGQSIGDAHTVGGALEAVSLQIPISAQAAPFTQWAAPGLGRGGLTLETLIAPLPALAGAPIVLEVARSTVVVEQEPNDDPLSSQVVPVPCEFAGRFYPEVDQDWIAFQARQGDVLWLEVTCDRYGGGDPFLAVSQVTTDSMGREQSAEILASDDPESDPRTAIDVASGDPAVRLTAPADGTFRVMIRDLAPAPRGEKRRVYRLSIRPPQPDFGLLASPRYPQPIADPNQNFRSPWSPLLRRGGSEVIEVLALRREGYDGPIEISADGLPPGVSAAPVVLGIGQRAAGLILRAADDAPQGVATIQVVGRGILDGRELVRAAVPVETIWAGPQPQTGSRSRRCAGIVVAVTATETAPYSIDAGPGQIWEMSRGGKLQIPFSVVRRGEFQGGLTVAAFGLPANVTAGNVNVDGGATTASIEINLQPAALPGEYSLYVQGIAQVSYRRNPEAAAAAAARRAELEKIVAETAEAARLAAEAAAAAAPGDREQAQKKSAEAAELARLAQEAKAAADRRAAETENAAQPRNINVAVASTPFRIRVTSAPVAVTVTPRAAVLKAGSTLEIQVAINRLYNFNDAVGLRVDIPGGVSGVSIPQAAIPAGQNQAALVVTASPDASPGTHEITLQLSMPFGGQNLQVAERITLTIDSP